MKLKKIAATLVFLILFTPLQAKEKFAETTKDGLKLQDHSSRGALYLKEGASLANYTRIKILDCYVEFEKNWQRNYNRSQIGLDHQITDSDMERMKQNVADEFAKSFTKELEKGGYEVVSKPGEDVLLLRPAILNLTVTAPQTRAAGWRIAAVRSSGTMSLFMELYDSASNTKIGEVTERKPANEEGPGHRGGAVSTNAEFSRTMDRWANSLLNQLDMAKNAQSP